MCIRDRNKNHAFGFSGNSLVSSFRDLPNPFKELGGTIAYHLTPVKNYKSLRLQLSAGYNFGLGRHLFINERLGTFLGEERFTVATRGQPIQQLTNWFDSGFGFYTSFQYRKRNKLEFGGGFNHFNEPAVTIDKSQNLRRVAYRSIGVNFAVARSWDLNFHHFYAYQANLEIYYYRLGMRYQIIENKPYFMDCGIIMRTDDLVSFHPSFFLDTDLVGFSMGIILKKFRVSLTFETVGSEFSNSNSEISVSYFIRN